MSIFVGSLPQQEWFFEPSSPSFSLILMRILLAGLGGIFVFSIMYSMILGLLYRIFCRELKFNLRFFIEKKEWIEIRGQGFRSLFSCIAMFFSLTVNCSLGFIMLALIVQHAKINEIVLIVVGLVFFVGGLLGVMWLFENLIRYLVERFILKKPKPVEHKASMFRPLQK